MDTKYIHTLELPKILDRLAAYCAFSGGSSLARALTPTIDLNEATRRQQETSEAQKLLSLKADVSIGGARDVRGYAGDAVIGAVLLPIEILEIKNTLIAGRALKRALSKLGDQFPRLAFIARRIDECPGVIEAIGKTIDERGEVMSSASEKLASIRIELKRVHDRLMTKLQSIITSSQYSPMMQEALITERDGRYVIPLKAEYKGKLRGVVHDQSSSGATLFLEPLATVDLNNEWRSLQLQEREEIRRILTELCKLIADHAIGIKHTVEALADLDLAFAKAKYADELHATEPLLKEIPNPKLQTSNLQSPISNLQSPLPNPQSAIRNSPRHPGSVIKLRGARHPLLDPATVVPIDFVSDDQTYVVLITGPNTGGKTVSLKTVGLLALMSQCGLHIPAQSGSEISIFEGVYADIGDEQSIEQSLSTFSSHISNIIQILKTANQKSLVLLDELGAGTDPTEGSALARAILSYLLDVGATTVGTTHYPELKVYAHTTPGVVNASVEFDLETLAPTYHLTIGLPGRSNAFAIATRLGLDETIIKDAQSLMPVSDLEAEKLLDEIHRQHDLAHKERALAEAVRADALALEAGLTRKLDAINDERLKILEAARAEAQKEIEEIREEAREMRRKLQAASLSTKAIKEIEVSAEMLTDEIESKSPSSSSVKSVPSVDGKKRPIRLGDLVYLSTLSTEGTVMSLTSTEAEVQIGRMRLRAKLDDLQTIEEKKLEVLSPKIPISNLQSPISNTHPSPGLEIDLRGQTVEEGLLNLERYLDSAYLAQLPWVRIIHGKGTGKLRQSVRDFLRASDIVTSHENGAENEGGDGVTVARLAIA
ncbi:MAG: Smr/MutS family protein [Chloroflexi bacterium]|nr:Smr/MutS family protein [Chloroflexota bacterium]